MKTTLIISESEREAFEAILKENLLNFEVTGTQSDGVRYAVETVNPAALFYTGRMFQIKLEMTILRNEI